MSGTDIHTPRGWLPLQPAGTTGRVDPRLSRLSILRFATIANVVVSTSNFHASLLPRYRGAAPVHSPRHGASKTSGIVSVCAIADRAMQRRA